MTASVISCKDESHLSDLSRPGFEDALGQAFAT